MCLSRESIVNRSTFGRAVHSLKELLISKPDLRTPPPANQPQATVVQVSTTRPRIATRLNGVLRGPCGTIELAQGVELQI